MGCFAGIVSGYKSFEAEGVTEVVFVCGNGHAGKRHPIGIPGDPTRFSEKVGKRVCQCQPARCAPNPNLNLAAVNVESCINVRCACLLPLLYTPLTSRTHSINVRTARPKFTLCALRNADGRIFTQTMSNDLARFSAPNYLPDGHGDR